MTVPGHFGEMRDTRRFTVRLDWRRRRGDLAFLALLATATGCGGPEHGRVFGRVLLDGSPLPGGTVKFRPVDGRANLVSVILTESGAFSVELPPGDVLVSVDNRGLEPTPQPAGPNPIPRGLKPEVREKLNLDKPQPAPPAVPTAPGRYVAIPTRYYLAESSKLTFTVQPGEMTHNLEMTSN